MTRRAYPWTFLVATLLLGGLTIGLAYIAFHAIGGGQVGAEFADKSGTTDYFGFVAVGAAVYMFTVRLMLWISRAFIEEEREGSLGALLVTPASRFRYLLGRTVFGIFNALLEVMVLAVFAVFLGATMVPALPFLFLAATLALVVATFGMSLLLALAMTVAGEAHITQNTMFYGMALLCGFTFPVSYLPEPVQWLAATLPITPALDVIRASMTGLESGDSIWRLGFSAVLGLTYSAVGLRLLPHAMQRAMERSY
ncbi:ABC transporter permease [Streptosporangium subroseum]|nr:ABC transporter permease [Streptosporangium subroseum]